MKPLQEITDSLAICKTDEEKISSLSQAFNQFSLESNRLEVAYNALKEQFKLLNQELGETNKKLHDKVNEFNLITDYLKRILDHMAQGILFIDFEGLVTTYNKAAEFILGIPVERALLQSFWGSFQDDAFGFSMREILNCKKAESISRHITYIAPNSQSCELEILLTAVQPASSKIEKPSSSTTPSEGLIVMLRDVTEVRELQIAANRTDRMKELGEIAAQVAHEIRNPLGGIKGFASLLARDLKELPHLQQMAAHIVQGTDELNRKVSQVLQYSRPVHLHLEKVNLLILLNEIKQLILADPNVATNPIEVAIEAPLQEIEMDLDAALFKSAILNLLVNAIQAMPEGGKVSISLQKLARHLLLSVTDTGVGISEENLGKLYSPFFTTKPNGNGLGLVEVQKVVLAHGGTIRTSSILGKGTTFVIKLPLTNVKL